MAKIQTFTTIYLSKTSVYETTNKSRFVIRILNP